MDKIKNILGLTLLGVVIVFASASATISNPPTVATVDTSTLVPYTGATSDVNLGSNGLTLADLTISGYTGLLKATAGVVSTSTAGVDYLTPGTNYKTIQWSASYASSTSQFDDVMFTFKNAATIDNVYVTSRDAANTVNWNLVYSTDPTTATSTAFKLFSSTQTTTSTPTSARNLTTFASSTPSAGMTLRMYSANASSTLTTWTIYYHE